MAYSFNQKRLPEFFIEYLPEHSSESLLIPDSFVSLCNRLMPKNAVLSNHVGSLWHVIVDCIDGKVFFLNGWKKFVRDNSIESRDLLIFRYNGQCGFSVKVFGQDACEKIENKANGTSYMNKVKLEDDEEEKQKEEEAKENDKEDEDCEDHDDDDNMDSDEDYIVEQEADSTKEESSIKNSRARKQHSVGNIGGSKKKDAGKVEGGSKRIDVIIIEAEEEESATRKSRARKQSGGKNGGSKKMAAVKVEAGFKRTNPINIEEEEEESTTRKNKAQKQSCGNNGTNVRNAPPQTWEDPGDSKEPKGDSPGICSQHLLVPSEEELSQIKRDPNSVVVPLFAKVLTKSDANFKNARLVVPRKCAQAFLPKLSEPKGFPITIQDPSGKDWKLHYRFWPNKSTIYVLKGMKCYYEFHQCKHGDEVAFYRIDPEGKFVLGVKKSLATSEATPNI